MNIQEQIIPIANEQIADLIVESDLHTLFVKNIPEEEIPLQTEDGEDIPGMVQKIPAEKIASLFLGEFDEENNHGLNKILYVLQSGDISRLEIHISSPGGLVYEGMTLYNIINALYKGRTTTYLNYGYSMGALVFLFGDERIVYENSSLMIHNWSGGFFGKSSDIEAHLKHSKELIWNFFNNIISKYLTKKEIDRVKRGEELWFTSREMLEKGIATSLIKDGEVYSAEEYLKKFDKRGNLIEKDSEEN